MEREPNVLCGIAISVSSTWRGKGIARIMIEAMRDLCVEKGLQRLILPVRPSGKHRFPKVAIDDYIGWTDDKGRIFDPRSEEHTSELQSLMRNSYAVLCLHNKKTQHLLTTL